MRLLPRRSQRLHVICRINSSLCMYLPAANGWMPLQSTTALRYLADITGACNASVNYDVAAAPAVNIIKHRVWPTMIIGLSFTQGLCRYYFRRSPSGNSVIFHPVGDGSSPKQFSSYCIIAPVPKVCNQLLPQTTTHTIARTMQFP
jgi:hypothetical protein